MSDRVAVASRWHISSLSVTATHLWNTYGVQASFAATWGGVRFAD
ncbi:hypothetical protein [Roseimicrobium gellanilyticum]|nr:hypothetical protein [Roseimicrobium gellanilyticum]